jgi:SHS2 domain-containing protein
MAIAFWAPTEEALLLEGARTLVEVLTDGHAPRLESTRNLEISAIDPEDRLVRWLNEVLILATLDGFLFADAEIHLSDGTNHNAGAGDAMLRATLRGQENAKMRVSRELKSVTYHGLKLARSGDAWRAEVVIDV